MDVLIPFDVNPVSERAVKMTLEMFGGQSDVHIFALHISPDEKPGAEIAANEIESLGAEYGVAVEVDIHSVTRPEASKPAIREAITDFVEANDIDLVVLGHEEKSLVDRLFRSDTTERLLETHDTPVLLVP